jgi:hypothetical protein
MENVLRAAFAETVASISAMIRPDLIPQRYHAGAVIPEANDEYHLTKCIERRLTRPIVACQFSFDDGIVDRVIASEAGIIAIEAKATLTHANAGSLLNGLEQQMLRLASPKFRGAVTARMADPFGFTAGGIWAIAMSNTFHRYLVADFWAGLHRVQKNGTQVYPCLSQMARFAVQNPAYTERPWAHLFAYRRIVWTT